ncbi:MAG: 3-hydroxyacyl-CoA dehydrogenase NAD-binding domain-containing protein [Myxococcota bacterium]|nr:3-hydroxyacyl-CoA dehydrogenase NAD-binding domain-containing protein [Myxococcota bacterium]
MIGSERDEAGVLTLTWDMPGRTTNVFNTGSLTAFSEAIEAAVSDDSVTGIVIASAKKTFIAGADLETLEQLAFGPRDVRELDGSVGVLSELLRRMETCGKPVVAAIGGTALGGGFELALACHHRIVADLPSIRVGLPEATLGLLPGAGGTQRVPRMVGVQASLPLLLEGKQLRPAKALKAGLVDQVVPAEQLLERARAWVRDNPGSHTQPWDQRGFQVPGGGMESPTTLQTLMVANAMYAAKTYGNYPAGRAILSCVYEGLRTTLDAALLIEKRYFLELLLEPTAGAMIRTLFLSLGDANKLVRRPDGIDKRAPRRIGVLGAGLMGAGVAMVAAKAGISVVVLDLTREKAEAALDYARGKLDRAIARGRSTEEKKAAVLSRIQASGDHADLADCDLVIEAVFEDREIKAGATRATDAVLGSEAILASNTSTLPITGLAEASSRPENFIGLHFFSPVERMPLVEVIVGERTSDRTLAWSLDAVQALGKTPIVVNDSRGFYTSRVFGTYITEGNAMLLDGVSPALIENAGAMSGMPMPPLNLADEVGLGLMYQVGIQTRKDLGDAAPDNPSQGVMEVLVKEHDRTGKGSGRGFYDYGEDGKRLWSELQNLFPVAAEQPSVDDLVERFLYVQAIEAARCMDQGVLRATEDADVGAILGWGFAPYTGGPLSYIDRIGAETFVVRADELTELHGPRFEPPELLRRMASEGTSFYG